MADPAPVLQQYPIRSDAEKGRMIYASLNPRRTRLACVYAKPDHTFCLSICNIVSGSWVPEYTHESVDAVCMCWSKNNVLAVGSRNGEVQIVFSTLGNMDGEEITVWNTNLQAFVRPGVAIVEMEFAPRCFGLKLLVAFCDGRVVVLVPDQPFLPNVWGVEGTLLVPGGLEVIGASWRSSLPGEPEGISVGASIGILVFWKSDADTWRLACENLGGGRHISSISWAPTNGREFDLIASAFEREVTIWRLMVESNRGLTLNEDVTINLKTPVADGPGCLLWSTSGIKLAIKSHTSKVSVYEQGVTGDWYLKEEV